MRVLLCSPLGGVAGGISRWTEKILSYYSNHKDSTIELDHFNTARNHYVDYDKGFLKRFVWGLIDYRNEYYSYKKHIKKKDYDVVHFTSSGSFGLLPLYYKILLNRKNNLRTIVHFRFGRIPELFNQRNWEYRLLLKVITAADSIIVLDKESLRLLSALGRAKVFLCPNPISDEIISLIDRNKIERIRGKVVFAGHVIPSKGVIELINVSKRIENIELELVGWCPNDMQERIRDVINNDNLSKKIILKGQLSLEDTIREMLSCEIFCLPSYTEGFPNVILEAMACGCPILTTDVGAIPEMLENEGGKQFGFLVKPKDEEGLYKGLISMLEDPTFFKECGENAKARVNERYRMASIWQCLTSIWKDN